MNELERQLHYFLGEALPEIGRSIEVAPGIKWLRMGLPFALDHINLWLLRDELDEADGPVQGWTVVDCCIDRAESRAQWEAVFANELEGLPILRVIVTHMHPDHIGLAHWLCERWSTPEHACRLWISATDFAAARVASNSTTGFGGDSAARFFARHGLVDEASQQKIMARAGYYAGMVPHVPASYRRLMDGQTVRIGVGTEKSDWRCIAGYGHAPEHIALACESRSLLISGDMVLPRISTNVSVYDLEPEADSLTLFLESIGRFSSLPADTLTLPSHGKPFTGLHTRIAQLCAQLCDHHRDRLAEVVHACAVRPCSAADIVPIMFRRELDLHQMTFAIGEALAHLHALWHTGRLTRRLGEDAVYRFAPS